MAIANYACIRIYIYHFCSVHSYCGYLYNGNLSLDHDFLQPITHAHLKQFYSVFILHRRFIKERLLNNDEIKLSTKGLLKKVNDEINKTIVHLYCVVYKLAIFTENDFKSCMRAIYVATYGDMVFVNL